MNTLPEIPQGRTKEEIQQREQVIKNFYVNWNAANPILYYRNRKNDYKTRNIHAIVI